MGVNADTVARYKYVSRGGKVDGFYSGNTFANQLGISTQVPNKVEIVSNNMAAKVREVPIGKRTFIVRRPVVPVNEEIPPERLSGGVKTLLLMLNEPEKIFNASTCGDNCAKWILEIGKQQNLTINPRHMMSFGKDTLFDIRIANGGEFVHTMKELVPIASKYLNEMKQE